MKRMLKTTGCVGAVLLFVTALALAAPKKPDGAKSDAGAKPAPATQESDGKHYPRDWFMGDAKQRSKMNDFVGKPLPDVFAEAWQPASASTDDMKGKYAVVMLWTTYEDGCIDALKKFESIKRTYKGKPLVFMAVATQAGKDEAFSLADKNKLTFAVGRDDQAVTYRAWHPSFWPTIAITDKEGNVRAMGVKPEFVENVVVALMKDSNDLPADYAMAPSSESSSPPTTQSSASSTKKKSTTKPKSDPMKGPLVNGIPRIWLRGSDEDRKRYAEIDNRNAPAIHGDGWVNSGAVGIENFSEDLVMLHFWSATNGASVSALGKDKALLAQYEKDGFHVVGLCNPAGGTDMAKLLEARGVKFPCAIDSDNTSAQRYHIEGSGDRFFFISRYGILIACDVEKSNLEDVLKILLQEKRRDKVKIRLGGREIGGGK